MILALMLVLSSTQVAPPVRKAAPPIALTDAVRTGCAQVFDGRAENRLHFAPSGAIYAVGKPDKSRGLLMNRRHLYRSQGAAKEVAHLGSIPFHDAGTVLGGQDGKLFAVEFSPKEAPCQVGKALIRPLLPKLSPPRTFFGQVVPTESGTVLLNLKSGAVEDWNGTVLHQVPEGKRAFLGEERVLGFDRAAKTLVTVQITEAGLLLHRYSPKGALVTEVLVQRPYLLSRTGSSPIAIARGQGSKAHEKNRITVRRFKSLSGSKTEDLQFSLPLLFKVHDAAVFAAPAAGAALVLGQSAGARKRWRQALLVDWQTGKMLTGPGVLRAAYPERAKLALDGQRAAVLFRPAKRQGEWRLAWRRARTGKWSFADLIPRQT